MNTNGILDRVRDVLAKEFDVPAERVSLDSRFADLNLDSLDQVDLVLYLEPVVGRRVRANELTQVATVGELVGLLSQLLAADPAGGAGPFDGAGNGLSEGPVRGA